MSVDASRSVTNAGAEYTLGLELESWERLEAAAAVSDEHLSLPLLTGGPANVRRGQRAQMRKVSLSDTLAVAIAVILVLLLNPPGGILSTVLIGLLWVGLLSLGEPRSVRRATPAAQQIQRVLRVSFALFGTVAGCAVIADWEAGKWQLLLTLPIGIILILVLRVIVIHRRRKYERSKGKNARRVLLMGTGLSIRQWEITLGECGDAKGYEVAGTVSLGHCACDAPQDPDDRVSTAVDAASRAGADTVILTDSSGLSPRAVRELGWRLSALDINLLIGASLQEVSPGRLWMESVGGLPLIHVEYPRLRGAAAATKRCFDVVFALTALVVVLPVLAIAAAAVVIESRGPVLFRQKRVGLDHRLFTMFKVRSMTRDAEVLKEKLQDRSEGNGVLFKMRQDPRVTRVGRVIRRFSIDELPQFFNVLTGDMSVVGPRPPLQTETENYDEYADRRMTVKPGITGPWQIGGRSDLSWEQSLRLDTYYVENWSLTGDLLIVAKTVRAVFGGSGAY